jgi:hypothetical protein
MVLHYNCSHSQDRKSEKEKWKAESIDYILFQIIFFHYLNILQASLCIKI